MKLAVVFISSIIYLSFANLYSQDSTKVIMSYYGLERPPLKLYSNGEYEIIDHLFIESYDINQTDTVISNLWQKGSYSYSSEHIDFYTPNNYQNLLLWDDDFSFEEFPSYQDTVSRFYRVYFGDKEFLINHFEIINYCNAINGGKEPSERLFEYSWKNTKNIGSSVDGIPQLPLKYSEYIFSETINCEIIRYTEKPHTFIIDKGSNNGLFEGAILYLDNLLKFEVIKTKEKISVIESTLPSDLDKDNFIDFKFDTGIDEEQRYNLAKETLNNIVIGTKLSTRLIKK